MDLTILAPNPLLLICAVIFDGLIGDPVYALHPIRLVGATLSFFERVLRG
ncbi:MAG: cobalamin biosynthesis protein, partial [Gemmatimonadetes bacterium]|nr:cobalamin biosynthesis protein [Gemmatimonadota bacterium]